ncbi:hypothetical protein sS8_4403 [Methylocaldum marinum]|uniref:Secreted protein n=1 Tax=Methylocaldum marinum TaxID=1432792 RepID=A0A250KXE1_9GAMM|nr:hypothetical protein [Methylocaldum marinum]BBA36333.1 hypothetical protein sS8_4403 [Methylocaldum marinum]
MKSYALAAVLSSLMVAGPALADNDFRALGQVSSLKPMTESQLAAVEGGQTASGFFSIGNTALNVATPTISAINASLFGLFGATTQTIGQFTSQTIH